MSAPVGRARPSGAGGRDSGPLGQALVIDRLRWWDLEQAQALEDDLFGSGAWTAGQFWSELARIPESRRYVAARRGRRLVGYAGLFLVGPDADVQTVAVAADEQGRGTGRRLLGELMRLGAEAGARVLRLEVRADNEPAAGLYAAMGFVVDGRRRDYYGRGLDAVLMSRALGGHDG